MLSIIFISSCTSTDLEKNTELVNPNQCKEDITNYVKENPLLDLQSELEKYCGSEKINNVEIIADPATGYKQAILRSFEGKEFKMAYYPDLRDAMNWLNENTAENDKIMTWWDYGTMVKVFAKREAVASIPSKDALKFVGSSSEKVKWSSIKLEDDSKLKKIAEVYITDDSSEAAKIMKEYDAIYLLIPYDIIPKFTVLWEAYYESGEFPVIDIDEKGVISTDNDMARKSIIYEAWNNEQTPGFKKVYSDENAVIYEISI